jgi:hypothetical protein
MSCGGTYGSQKLAEDEKKHPSAATVWCVWHLVGVRELWIREFDTPN